MKQNNLNPQDLALALSMVVAKTSDMTIAEQHIIDVVDGKEQTSENSRVFFIYYKYYICITF